MGTLGFVNKVQQLIQRFPVPLAGFLRALGLGLALFLGFMKLAALPCGLGVGCDLVLTSRYALIFGVPTGFFAAVLWLLAILSPRIGQRKLAHHLLGMGSLVFVIIQAFVIQRFCAWCLVHAALCWLSWPSFWAAGNRSWCLLGLALGLGGHLIQQQQVSAELVAHKVNELTILRREAFDWLGASRDRAPILVLSLNCPSCWERWLTPLGAKPWKASDRAPLILWKGEGHEREMTAVFVAAVLSQTGDRSNAFASVLAIASTQRDLLINNPEGARLWLSSTFPDVAAHLAEARALLDRQSAALAELKLSATPLLVDDTKTLRADSSFGEFF